MLLLQVINKRYPLPLRVSVRRYDLYELVYYSWLWFSGSDILLDVLDVRVVFAEVGVYPGLYYALSGYAD